MIWSQPKASGSSNSTKNLLSFIACQSFLSRFALFVGIVSSARGLMDDSETVEIQRWKLDILTVVVLRWTSE